MENWTILLIVFGILIGVGLCFFVLFPLLKKKGVDTEEFLKKLTVDVKGLNSITDALKAMFPNVEAVKVIDKIVDYAEIGVAKAEQLYKIHQIEGDQRKAEATKFVYDNLEMAGIEITDQIKAIVDGCIEAAVLGLGHKPEALPSGKIAK